jgi:LCP family protein required for cell wall assembly
MVIFGALLMLGSGGTIVGSKALISHVTSGIQQENLLGSAAKTEEEGGGDLEGPINLLLLGVDYRERNGNKNDTRSDTIIILHIPATHDQAYLLSFPRDTEVQIPPFEKSGYPGGTAKATEAFFFGAQNGGGWAGGAQLVALTIKNMTGISFDGAAIINFGGFKKIIDALGGVHMCVDHEVKSIHMELVDGKPMWKHEARKVSGRKEPVIHKVGCRHMEGWEALDYARQRESLPNKDYGRQQNQQKLIKAMAKKAMDTGILTNPLKVNELIKAAGEAIIFDPGGIKIVVLIFVLGGVAANDLVMLRTNNGTFNGFVNERGQSMERLDETSLAMFRAVSEDRLGEFVANNPSVLAGAANS